MFDPDDYELHEAQKHACKMARERDEARVIADRLTGELDKCALALPGVYYMDQPDGGDVSVSEQLKRMAKDAERYRLLRRKFAIISDGEGHAEFCAINLPRPTYIAPSSAIELDTALDRELLGLDGARPPTPTGWNDTDWIRHLQEQKDAHPLAGQHINQGSMDAAADAWHLADLRKAEAERLRAELAASREREARMRAKLEYALQQNDLDMLLTGDEIRDCRAALAEGLPQ